MMPSVWLALSGGYVAQLSQLRAKRGVKPPFRFLVLGPSPTARGVRPLVCSGSLVDGYALLDAGVIDEQMRKVLEAKCIAAIRSHAER
jgi:hypothetical protein